MELIFLFGLLSLLIIILVVSAKLVESSFIHISKRLRINEFLLGFFVLAIITSLPEISIAVLSSNSAPELSLGNLIGATIVILTLIIGISAVKYKGITFKGRFSEREVIIGLITIALMVVVIGDAQVTLIESFLLVGSYAIFIYYLFKKFTKKGQPALFLNIDVTNPVKIFFQALIGIVGILISSSYIVTTAGDIATILGVSQTVIGILMLAVGTNLPELTILLTVKNLEEEELAIGGFFGSACVNVAILGLLGITSRGFIIQDFVSIVGAAVILVFSIVLFLIFSWSGKKLSKVEGMLLVSAYAAFVFTEFAILFTKA